MHRLGFLIGSVLLLGACAPQASSSSPPTGSPVVLASPAASAAPKPTPTPVEPGTCPRAQPIPAGTFADTDPACFGSADVEVIGWLDAIPGIGFEPPGVEPGWLFYPTTGLVLWSQEIGPDGECLQESAPCGWSFAQVDPASEIDITGPARWVILTGHRNDPAAETCHYVYPDDWEEPAYDDAEAIAACRTRFVIVAIRDAP